MEKYIRIQAPRTPPVAHNHCATPLATHRLQLQQSLPRLHVDEISYPAPSPPRHSAICPQIERVNPKITLCLATPLAIASPTTLIFHRAKPTVRLTLSPINSLAVVHRSLSRIIQFYHTGTNNCLAQPIQTLPPVLELRHFNQPQPFRAIMVNTFKVWIAANLDAK
ncbi:hypothetical protein PtA15_11A380 [Puccinia triticina]|uniref:Uncharacterized protein n=1 Tax=Puccinia triticina TaxID=208348 RepID=A0ABY7CWM3_9BASI|nr:uncharacterized protein PtA15_11A380 [Puccinia triticina]WAQ89689.1 hypothetical protein PtA15_11A380 [Puccinia triticina]